MINYPEISNDQLLVELKARLELSRVDISNEWAISEFILSDIIRADSLDLGYNCGSGHWIDAPGNFCSSCWGTLKPKVYTDEP